MGEHLPVSLFFSEGSDSATPEADQGVSVVERFRGGLGLRLPTHGRCVQGFFGAFSEDDPNPKLPRGRDAKKPQNPQSSPAVLGLRV